MTQLAEVIRGWLGWCPRDCSRIITPPRTQVPKNPAPLQVAPQPGTAPAYPAIPGWMDAIAVVILFATLFVGGNLWWVAFVFAVLVLFVIIRIRAVRAHTRS
ncbi:MAG: hypothetical protein WCX63_09235 [Methanoregula sp.]